MDEQTLHASLKEIAKSALDVQNACNLQGVVLSFTHALNILREASRYYKEGTDWINQHPVSKLYSDKIASLSGTQFWGSEEVSNAYGDCEKLANSESLPVA